jgi:pimeloyl-ACP methyl ester carboxylesterase/predicted small secreted protein
MKKSRSLLLPLAAAAAAVALSACATRIPVGTDFKAASDRYETLVDLRFVTNRGLVHSGRGDYFGDGHGDLSAGICRVGFEPGKDRGDVLRVDTGPLEAAFSGAAPGLFVIYVHGYGEYFAKNCRRAALLQQRLGLDDRMLLFSWPSSSYLTYAGDAKDLERSIDELNDLLTRAVQAVGHDRIVLMAHSMGSRGLVAALHERGDDDARFHSAIFVAPDIRRDVFRENVAMLQQRASDITVYMSDHDRVLWLSTTVNVSGRLGVASEFDLEHANVVDISPTGTNDISGHLYHMLNPAVIEDLRALLGSDEQDVERNFHRVPGELQGFWRLEPIP